MVAAGAGAGVGVARTQQQRRKGGAGGGDDDASAMIQRPSTVVFFGRGVDLGWTERGREISDATNLSGQRQMQVPVQSQRSQVVKRDKLRGVTNGEELICLKEILPSATLLALVV